MRQDRFEHDRVEITVPDYEGNIKIITHAAHTEISPTWPSVNARALYEWLGQFKEVKGC